MCGKSGTIEFSLFIYAYQIAYSLKMDNFLFAILRIVMTLLSQSTLKMEESDKVNTPITGANG
ncbi:hypothetical protein Hanom_Chr17g01580461 [Helianthus anomalus]